MQTCERCHASWVSPPFLKQCPFCGETLVETENPVFCTVQDVFRYLIQQHGMNFLSNYRMPACLNDLAPQFTKETGLIRIGVESGAYQALIDMDGKSENEKKHCFYKEVERLKNDYYLDSVWAEQVLFWLSDALSWGITYTGSSEEDHNKRVESNQKISKLSASKDTNDHSMVRNRIYTLCKLPASVIVRENAAESGETQITDSVNKKDKTALYTVIYNCAVTVMRNADSEAVYMKAASYFETIKGFKDSDSRAKQCLENAENCRKDSIYSLARSQMLEDTLTGYETAIKTLRTIPGWKDADKQISTCLKEIEKIWAEKRARRLEQKRKEEEQRLAKQTRSIETTRRAHKSKAEELNKKTFRDKFAVIPPIISKISVVIVTAGIIILLIIAMYYNRTLDIYIAKTECRYATPYDPVPGNRSGTISQGSVIVEMGEDYYMLIDGRMVEIKKSPYDDNIYGKFDWQETMTYSAFLKSDYYQKSEYYQK